MKDEIKKLEEVYSNAGDILSRRIKAKRIIDIIGNYAKKGRIRSCLEVGTGPGVMSEIFGRKFDDFKSVDMHDIRLKKNNRFNYIRSNVENLPFKKNQFDVIIFNHVYQYINEKDISLIEISRVLKEEGVCYFTSSNKFALIDPHYSLPLLGYLPKNMADLYLKICSKNHNCYNIKSESHSDLSLRLNRYFNANDITVELIKNYKEYDFSDLSYIYYVSLLPKFILNILNRTIATNWVFILKKRSANCK